MSARPSAGQWDTSMRTIFLIRHGEKPADNPPPHGVTADGDHDCHSLSTRGWQRAGALVDLFAPLDKQFRAGFAGPARLVAPKYTDSTAPPANERTHQTIEPIRQVTGFAVETPCKVGDEDVEHHGKTLGQTLAEYTGVTLVCWEHRGLQPIAKGIAPDAAVPPWDGTRFDMVWVLTSETGPTGFTFQQIAQLLLPGDSPHPIAVKKSAEAPTESS